MIQDIYPDCGCTDAYPTKSSVLPNDTCLLNFSFNTHHKQGYQSNFIFIVTNTDSIVHLLELKSIVRDTLN